MFHFTRNKLTLWYLLIITFVSLTFSFVLYVDVNRELVRFEQFQIMRQKRLRDDFGQFHTRTINSAVDAELINEARERLIASLILLNLCILAGAGLAGYFLAGRTLDPIRRMLEEQNRFIGDASHELKTPLTSLRSEIEVYLRGKKHTINDADTILKSNLEDVIRLQNLTDNLITLSKFDKNTSAMKVFDAVDLQKVIDDSMAKVKVMAKEKNMKIVINKNELIVLGDEMSLTELFVILLDNAIKYSPKNTNINISMLKVNDEVQIVIEDDGNGIAQEEVSKIFNRFYRADKSRSTVIAGYGLGLSIAKDIVQIHGGSIKVKSKLGVGSSFTVTFPQKS